MPMRPIAAHLLLLLLLYTLPVNGSARSMLQVKIKEHALKKRTSKTHPKRSIGTQGRMRARATSAKDIQDEVNQRNVRKPPIGSGASVPSDHDLRRAMNRLQVQKEERARQSRQKAQRSKKQRKFDQHADLVRSAQKVGIRYNAAPANRMQRRQRESEQQSIARAKGRDWLKLSSAQKARRIEFGSEAYAGNPIAVRRLSHLNGRIASRKQLEASWDGMTVDQMKAFNSLVGRTRCAALFASNKQVRTEGSYRFALAMEKVFQTAGSAFRFITLTDAQWHSRHNDTIIDLRLIRRTVQRVMRRCRMDWVGFIEFDICNNWPGKGDGLAIMPHAHIIAWSSSSPSPRRLEQRLSATRLLKPLMGRPTVVVRPVPRFEDLMHRCYYVFKPNHQVKSFRLAPDGSTLEQIYSVEASARASQVLRIAEILSHFTLDEILLSGGAGGRQLGEDLLADLEVWRAKRMPHAPDVDSIGQFWNACGGARYRQAYPEIRVIR
jgi:hypothetical protein